MNIHKIVQTTTIISTVIVVFLLNAYIIPNIIMHGRYELFILYLPFIVPFIMLLLARKHKTIALVVNLIWLALFIVFPVLYILPEFLWAVNTLTEEPHLYLTYEKLDFEKANNMIRIYTYEHLAGLGHNLSIVNISISEEEVERYLGVYTGKIFHGYALLEDSSYAVFEWLPYFSNHYFDENFTYTWDDLYSTTTLPYDLCVQDSDCSLKEGYKHDLSCRTKLETEDPYSKTDGRHTPFVEINDNILNAVFSCSCRISDVHYYSDGIDDYGFPIKKYQKICQITHNIEPSVTGNKKEGYYINLTSPVSFDAQWCDTKLEIKKGDNMFTLPINCQPMCNPLKYGEYSLTYGACFRD